METTMYDILLQLPLFQGLGKNDFTNVLSKVKLHFSNFKAGNKIISKGSPCKELVFILSGRVKAETELEGENLLFGEILSAPYLIEPFSIFGFRPAYQSTYVAESDVSIITIDKEYISKELNKYETFRINYINILSNGNQHLYERVRMVPNGSAEKRIIDLVYMLSDVPAGEKCVRVKMDDLAVLLSCARSRISEALNLLQDRGLITLQRKGFKVHALERLRSKY